MTREAAISSVIPHNGSPCGEIRGAQQDTITHIHTSFHAPRTKLGAFFLNARHATLAFLRIDIEAVTAITQVRRPVTGCLHAEEVL